jgi:hypothetical protein
VIALGCHALWRTERGHRADFIRDAVLYGCCSLCASICWCRSAGRMMLVCIVIGSESVLGRTTAPCAAAQSGSWPLDR